MRRARTVPLLLLMSIVPASLAAQTPLGERQRALLAAGVDAALAVGSLPDGWRVERVEVAVGVDGAAEYRIVHRSDAGRCFAIEGRPAGGFGGPVPSNDREVPVPGIDGTGNVRIYWTTGPGEGGPFPVRTVFSDWIPTGTFAHRFVSPSDPRAGCEAVTPGAAEALVGSLAPVEAADAGGEYLRLGWNDPTIEARAGESAGETALRILDVAGLGLGPAERSGEGAVEEIVEERGAVGDSTVVVVTRIGGADDSVAGVRYRVGFRPIGEGRLEFRVERAFRCRAGRGHEGWGAELCL